MPLAINNINKESFSDGKSVIYNRPTLPIKYYKTFPAKVVHYLWKLNVKQFAKSWFSVSHRYPPIIPMSVDEQAVPPEVSPSMAANIPQMVHDQLAAQFLPGTSCLG